jgi:hypothetical protein
MTAAKNAAALCDLQAYEITANDELQGSAVVQEWDIRRQVLEFDLRPITRNFCFADVNHLNEGPTLLVCLGNPPR